MRGCFKKPGTEPAQSLISAVQPETARRADQTAYNLASGDFNHIGSPKIALACRHSASTSGLMPGSGFSALASNMRLTSSLMPGEPATTSFITWRSVALKP